MLRGVHRALVAILLAGVHTAARGASAADPALTGEPYRVTAWTTANGLPQNSVNSLLQTPDGALWIATFGGLLRFDGLEFRVFGKESTPGLPSIRITSLASDRGEGLWVATVDRSVVHLLRDQIVETVKPPEEVNEVLAVAVGGEGLVYVRGSTGALARWTAGSWTMLLPPGTGGASYQSLCSGPDGSVWATAGQELLRFAPGGAPPEALSSPDQLTAVAPGEDGVWLGFENGLGRARNGVIERCHLAPELSRRVIAVLGSDSDGVWISTNEGPRRACSEAAGARWVLEPAPNGVPPGFGARTLLRDREGNLWAGSNGQGLLRIARHSIRRFVTEARDAVSALATDGAGGIWIGLECGGLRRFGPDDASLPVEPLTDGETPLPCVNALLCDVTGRSWVCAQGRLLVQSDGGWKLLHRPGAGLPKCGPIVQTRDGDVWVAVHRSGFLHFGPDGSERAPDPSGTNAFCLVAGADGALWVGGTGVVERHLDGRVERYGTEQGLPHIDMRDVLAEPDGSAWVATYGAGLLRIAGGRVARISLAQGLPDNALSAILDDGHGRLWLLSNRGLIPAERAELLAVAEGRRARFDPILLGPESGVPEGNRGAPAGLRDAAGRLWFGTIAGAVRVDPAEFPFNRTPPKVRIERLLADESPLPCGARVTVPPRPRRLVFEYTASALTAPERVRFRYQLEGFDDAWVEGGNQREVTYTGLAPGDYTFRVLARNEDGVWGEESADLELHVLPAWWQTVPFRMAAFLAVAAALLSLHRLRLHAAERRARVLLEAVEGRAQAEEHASRLREDLAHVNRVATAGELATSLAHEVNQPLAAIVANAEAGLRSLQRGAADVHAMEEILRDIAQQGERTSQVIRRLRTFLRKHGGEHQEIDLNAMVNEVLALLRRELHDHAVEVQLDLSVERPRVVADRVQIQQVLVNLVKNACEALSGQEAPRRITVRTGRQGGRAVLAVRDTGPGLSPKVAAQVFQPFVTTKAEGMGLGLAICLSIVEACGGQLSVDSSPGGGSTFFVDLPAVPVEGSGT